MNKQVRPTGLLAIMLLALAPVVLGQEGKPRVYINGTGNIDVQTNAGAVGGRGWAVGSSHSTVGAHNQTMELAKDFSTQCPAVTVTLNAADSDYTVGLNHDAFHGVIHKNNQIMVTNRRGDLVFANATRAVSHSANDSCAAILADWKANGKIELPVVPAAAQASVASPPPPQTNADATTPPQPAMQVVPGQQTESLGDVARRLKAQRAVQQQNAQQTTPPKHH